MGLETQMHAFSLTRRMEPAPLQTEKGSHCLAPLLFLGPCFLPGVLGLGECVTVETCSDVGPVMWEGAAQVRDAHF